jgi:Na+/H+ antiporter NhaC
LDILPLSISLISAQSTTPTYGLLSITPPLIAIILAILTRKVIVSLFAGVFIGSFILCRFDPLSGLLRCFDHFIVNALSNPDNIRILLFTFAIGGMVGIMTRSGGTRGLAEAISKMAKSPRTGQLSTALAGNLVFFDDYANCYIVGNTMRPIADKLRISREKLSYIVDSTAASDACIIIVSTWIGYQLSLLTGYCEKRGLGEYQLFFETIPFSFYSLFTIVLVYLIALTFRDFGSMLKAERRSYLTGKVLRDGAVPLMNPETSELEPRGITKYFPMNAIAPITVVTIVVLVGLYLTGYENAQIEEKRYVNPTEIGTIIRYANAFNPLIWASLAGCVIALICALRTKTLSLKEGIKAWLAGCRTMVIAGAILVLAWSIKGVCEDLRLGEFIANAIKGFDIHILSWLPSAVFLISCGVAFSTGTSWGTMGIVTPVVLEVLGNFDPASISNWYAIEHASIAAVLSGAIFGDHISPISDTTILSSTGTSADHIDHVRTQIPYGLLSATVALFLGFLPTGFGVPVWLLLPCGAIFLFAFVMIFGKNPVKIPEIKPAP